MMRRAGRGEEIKGVEEEMGSRERKRQGCVCCLYGK